MSMSGIARSRHHRRLKTHHLFDGWRDQGFVRSHERCLIRARREQDRRNLETATCRALAGPDEVPDERYEFVLRQPVTSITHFDEGREQVVAKVSSASADG